MTSIEVPKTAKKRKFTDKSLPTSMLKSLDFPDSKFYQQLLDMERKLDWTIARKRSEVQDALGKGSYTNRTLRIYLSHTVSDQAWQATSSGAANAAGDASGGSANPDFNSGRGIPAWALKIEGRLLEPPGRARDRDRAQAALGGPKRFSDLIRHLVVDLERDPALYPDGNTVEWRRPQGGAPSQDGFTVRRTGDTPTRVRILLYLEHTPDQYKVHPELTALLDVREESKIGIVTALWNYIKLNNLQDKADRKIIRLDDKLKALFHVDSLPFQKLPEYVNHFLQPPDPITLYYTIRPSEAPPVSPQAWDAPIRLEDTALKSRWSSVLVSASSESARTLARLEERAAILAAALHNAEVKRAFLERFAEEPAAFIERWLASQSRDLAVALAAGPGPGLGAGESAGSGAGANAGSGAENVANVREEELRRSEFFRLPWVEEAVAVQEGLRLATRSSLAGQS